MRKIRFIAQTELDISLMLMFGMIWLMVNGIGKQDYGIMFSLTGNIIFWVCAPIVSFVVSWWFVWKKKLYPLNTTNEDEKEMGL